MSTKSFIPEMRRGNGPSVLVLLGALLITLHLMLPAATFASPARIAALTPPADQAFALAEVSAVRLVVSYASNTPPVAGGKSGPSAACTGLGVLVASWVPANAQDENTWVLTEGDLVNQNSATCAQQRSAAQISALQVYANNVYTSNQQGLLLTASNFVPKTVRCGQPCSNSAALFAFHTDQPQPFLAVASSTTSQPSPFGIELTNGQNPATIPPQSNAIPKQMQQYLQQMPQYLTPTREAASSTLAKGALMELGMPLVDSNGQLAGIQLTANKVASAQEITQLLSNQPELKATAGRSNDVNMHWSQGIRDYYAGNFTNAQQEFTAAKNASFTAPMIYLTAIAAQPAKGSGGQSNASVANGSASSSGIEFFGIHLSLLSLLLLSVAGLIVLVIILVLVSLRFGAARARRREELADFAVDQAQAQHIADMEVQRQQQSRRVQTPDTLLVDKSSTPRSQPSTSLPCPNCHQPVQVNAEYCPNCRYLLSPSASGLHLRAIPPAAPVSDAPAFRNPPASPIPQSRTQDVRPASSISDIPTTIFPPDGQSNMEKTEKKPYTVEQVTGRNLSLAVGTRTDPGIKRKHKPNEDSLFAMQGERTHNSQPQQFGLFVVADGMGGHALGQDASRLAIQTIINYLLPILSAGDEMSDEGFMKLLSDGVQQANHAVHQNNQERRADMGTTMTAALVVGSMAYVANVGDSRTYLYHEPEGLVKITHDHSVVASLVDAGVIKPDDIYTHPKRNQIYRSLGEKPVVEVDTFKVQLQPGDKLLLCSDGLWDMVRDPDIQRLMCAPVSDPSPTSSGLIQAALDGGGEDNVSVIVVHVTEATNRTGVAGIQLLAKPDSVSIPNL